MVVWMRSILLLVTLLSAFGFIAIRIISMQLLNSEEAVLDKLSEGQNEVTFRNQETDGYNIRWVEIGNPSKPTAFFIHGSPGAYDNFEAFFSDDTLLSRFQIVSIDRPGFGGSEKGKTVKSIIEQARLIQPVVEMYSSTPTVLIGWSYGGPLVTALAGLYPNLVQGIILLASAASAEHEKIFFFNRPFSSPVLSWMLPTMMRVSNEEKLSHQSALREMEHLYKNISIPVTQIHGDADPIVPVENGEYVAEMLDHNPNFNWIRNMEDNHFLPSNQKGLIVRSIIEVLEQ